MVYPWLYWPTYYSGVEQAARDARSALSQYVTVRGSAPTGTVVSNAKLKAELTRIIAVLSAVPSTPA